MNRKLSDWASIAEMVAAFGVIVSLIFVGFQIADGNNETRAATTQAALDSEMFLQSHMLKYAGMWEKVVSGLPLEEGEETRRGILIMNMLMTLNENRFHQVNSGYLEHGINNFEIVLNFPFFETWRASGGARARSPEFPAVQIPLESRSRNQTGVSTG